MFYKYYRRIKYKIKYNSHCFIKLIYFLVKKGMPTYYAFFDMSFILSIHSIFNILIAGLELNKIGLAKN